MQNISQEFQEEYPEVEVALDVADPDIALGVKDIERAFHELIENAIIHNDKEHPWVGISIANEDVGVSVRIADNGPGIFDAEVRTIEEVTRNLLEHGSGLGIDLAYWVIRRSGGRLTMTAREPEGTVLTIWLPSTTNTQ